MALVALHLHLKEAEMAISLVLYDVIYSTARLSYICSTSFINKTTVDGRDAVRQCNKETLLRIQQVVVV